MIEREVLRLRLLPLVDIRLVMVIVIVEEKYGGKNDIAGSCGMKDTAGEVEAAG